MMEAIFYVGDQESSSRSKGSKPCEEELLRQRGEQVQRLIGGAWG